MVSSKFGNPSASRGARLVNDVRLAIAAALALCVVLLCGSASAAMGAPAAAGSDAAAASVIPGEYIVVLKDSVERPGAVARAQTEEHGGDLAHVFPRLNGYGAELSKDAVEQLRGNPKVKYVEPNRKVTVDAQTLPTGLSRSFAAEQPALDIDETDDVRINADVAIIDTGVDYLHPDLNVVARTDCSNKELGCVDNTSTDKFGHGTHVAGIVGALDNSFGAVGIAPGARLWSVKVLNDNGTGSDFTIIAGIEWVTAHASEIEVANMSLGHVGVSASMIEKIAESINAGVVFAVAAGNDNADVKDYSPSSSPDAIVTSALSDYDGKVGGLAKQNCETSIARGKDDVLAAYSNWGSNVDIAAPGTCIYSTLPTTGSVYGSNYKLLTGTSMASPHVAGAAAILAAQANPNSKADVEAIKQKLVAEGNLNWNDNSNDGVHEPLLDLRPPTSEANTFPASDLKPTSTRLNAVLSAGGLASSYRFEYGTTTSYGTSFPATPKGIGSGVGDLEVNEVIQVKPETTYHYRVVMTNSKGTFYGEDKSFKPSFWSIQSTPNPEEAADFSDVSCPSSTFCMAVGRKAGKPFAEQWNGSEWSLVSVPPEGNSWLTDLSCTTSSFCMAIGYGTKPFAERWNGSEWSIVSAPPEAKEGFLTSLSCTSSSFCVAVGQYVPAAGEAKTLIDAWNGSGWTTHTSPNPEGKKLNLLTGVSCSSTTACTAVGWAQQGGLGGQEKVTLVERWNGSVWSLQGAPNPPGSTMTELEGVACPSATLCMAVGKANSTGFAELWSGGEWKVSASGLSAPLLGVSCKSPTSCDAGGYTVGRHWDGTSWTAEDFASPESSTQVTLTDVSCVPGSPCVAVGSHYTGARPLGEAAPGTQPLAERLTPVRSFVSEKASTSLASSKPSEQSFSFGTNSTSCDAPAFSGTLSSKLSSSVSLSAADAKCYAQYVGDQMKMNGCTLQLNPGPSTLDIQCPEGKAIAFQPSTEKPCLITVPAQSGLAVGYGNQGTGTARTVKVSVAASGLRYTRLSGTFCGPLGTFTNGTWTGNWTLGGTSGASPVGIYVGENPIMIDGTPPKLIAGAYPMSIVGKQSTVHSLSLQYGKAECATADFATSASEATSQLPLGAVYDGCTVFGFAGSISMNGCTYTASVLNQAPVGSTYAGHADVTCPAGKAIEILAKSGSTVKCTITIGAQTTNSEGLSFTNQASGTIGLGLSVGGIDYHLQKGEGLGSCPTGDFTNGTYTGSSTLSGV